MTDLRNVQAAAGARVLDPVTMTPIPAFGNAANAFITIDADRPFWFRRLRDLDVIEVDAEGKPIVEDAAEPETPAPAPPPKPSTKASTPDTGAPIGAQTAAGALASSTPKE